MTEPGKDGPVIIKRKEPIESEPPKEEAPPFMVDAALRFSSRGTKDKIDGFLAGKEIAKLTEEELDLVLEMLLSPDNKLAKKPKNIFKAFLEGIKQEVYSQIMALAILERLESEYYNMGFEIRHVKCVLLILSIVSPMRGPSPEMDFAQLYEQVKLAVEANRGQYLKPIIKKEKTSEAKQTKWQELAQMLLPEEILQVLQPERSKDLTPAEQASGRQPALKAA